MASRSIAAAAAVVALAVVSTLAPVWTYALSLALFGLPHVACELRYVDQRFGSRIGARTAAVLGAGLLLVAFLRLAGVGRIGDAESRLALELGLGALLALAVLPVLAARSALAAGLGVLAVLLGCTLAATDPLSGIVGFAFLHNLTPVGLLWERLRGEQRRRAMTACVVGFGAVPAAIATGLLGTVLAGLGLESILSGPAAAGDLAEHAGVFVPPAWVDTSFGTDLFRAAAFLQCMHHGVVLLVLPRLGADRGARETHIAWPHPRTFVLTVAAASIVLAVAHLVSFHDARACYGVFASIHAWIEVPVLLLACAAAAPRGTPTVVRAA